MSQKRFIGIDLGTSNSAMAVSETADSLPVVLPILQVTAPGSIAEKPLLPSSLYIPHENEIEGLKSLLPWENSDTAVVGSWARERGAQVPERLITSAKSWLCNAQMDRKAPCLPWKSTIAETKFSPWEATRRYLEHLRQSYEHSQKEKNEPFKWNETQVVLTVPASFDEVARSLTFEAAERAGLGRVTLLEEPQAAFYAWIAQNEGDWRKQVRPGDLVLVVDVGGGTTDLSLISVSVDDGNLKLERVSVGEHLLLGGDNMDLALAYHLKTKIESDGQKLDHWQFLSLVHSVRIGKEKLFSNDTLAEFPISVASRGSSLIAKTLTAKLTRTEAETLLIDGFFPKTQPGDLPAQRKSLGIQEYGLPFVFDPAVSKHLARFLTRSLENVKSDANLSKTIGEDAIAGRTFLQPTAVLFNGGVFNAKPFRDRVTAILGDWANGAKVRELEGADMDLAVAKGAAYFARLLGSEKGIRIKAGTARSYYLGLEASMPAVPGFEPPIMGLCVVPQGLEEGAAVALTDQEFGLVTGEPVEFRFFSSSVRAGDKPGVIVENAASSLEETSRLQITLPSVEGATGDVVPVNLDAIVTEVGTLELWMKHPRTGKKWNLEFNVRPN